MPRRSSNGYRSDDHNPKLPQKGNTTTSIHMRSGIQPGWYIWVDSTTFIVEENSSQLNSGLSKMIEANPLMLSVMNTDTGERGLIAYPKLLEMATDEKNAPIIAPSRAAFEEELIQRGLSISSFQDKLSMGGREAKNNSGRGTNESFKRLRMRAEEITHLVELIHQQMDDRRRQAFLQVERFQEVKALVDICAELDSPIALSTYYKYRKLYEECHRQTDAIAATLHRKTYNVSSFDKATEHFLDTILVKYYGRYRSTNISYIYKVFAQTYMRRTGNRWIDPNLCKGGVPADLVNELLDLEIPFEKILNNPEKCVLLKRIKLPSQSTFARYARWFVSQSGEGQSIIAARYGKRMWEDERLVFDTFVTRAQYCLHYVFADHYLLDIFSVDEQMRLPWRLWLTVLLDAYSRCPLGFALLTEDPSIYSIQTALCHAVLPKTSHTELGVQGDYPCFGIPLTLCLDNAWAHHSRSLEALSRSISSGGRYDSINLNFRPPYRARRGALIERFFGNVSRQIKETLPGAILSSKPKDVGAAKESACLLYKDLLHYIHMLFVTYLHTPHSGLGGMTPAQKWYQGIRSRIPHVPPPTPATYRLFLRNLVDTRAITSRGIGAFGMHYTAPALAKLPKIGRNGEKLNYEVRFDPHDISRIALFGADQFVCDLQSNELKLADNSPRPLSMVERDLAKRIAVESGDSAANWLAYVERLSKLQRQREEEKRQARMHLEQPSVDEREPWSSQDTRSNTSALNNVDERTKYLREFTD
jgi:transposase InsO family protein